MHVILYAIVPIIVVMLAGYISGKKVFSMAMMPRSSIKSYSTTLFPPRCSYLL